MSPPRRQSSRRSVLSRVGDVLTSSGAVWMIGSAVGVTVLVAMSMLGPVVSLLLATPLVLAAAAALVLKDGALIVRRRILITRRRVSRRQFLATALSISFAAGLTIVFGRLLEAFILGSYEDQVRRQLSPPKPKAEPK
jgi:hypothetical protein